LQLKGHRGDELIEETDNLWHKFILEALEEELLNIAESMELALADYKTDNEPKSCLENHGTKESVEIFSTFWKALKEVCTESKE